jgi:Ca-activated chloride channel family protein
MPIPTQFRIALTACCLIAIAASTVKAQEEVIRTKTSLVNLNAVVTDRQGRRVSGLTKEDFEVYEDGTRQEILHFTADERPLRLVLVFDVSISMEAVLPGIKQEAITFLDSLRADDELSVVTFASDVRRFSAWMNKEKAGDFIKRITAEPHPQPVPATVHQRGYRVGDMNTYLYEALYYLFENFNADDDRIAVILFSDGIDTGAGRVISDINRRVDRVAKEVRRQAQESWALVYAIRYKTEQAIGDMPTPARRPFPVIRIGKAPADPGPKLFEQITAATGGEIFEWTTRQDLIAALRDALADLRSQYGLAYRPQPRDGRSEFRRLKVRVKRPNLVVRTREGYLYNP